MRNESSLPSSTENFYEEAFPKHCKSMYRCTREKAWKPLKNMGMDIKKPVHRYMLLQ